MGHGARVTSWGQGTSSANPLGFGKLRAVPQLGAANPWCNRTPPPSACPPPAGAGHSPRHILRWVPWESLSPRRFPPNSFPSSPGMCCPHSHLLHHGRASPMAPPCPKPQGKAPGTWRPQSPPPGCSPQGSNPTQSHPARTQPCRELCPARSHCANCSGRAQVRLPPARLWLNLIISGADTRPALPRLAHASPSCSAPSPGLCSGCGAGCQHESAAPSPWSSPAGLETRRLPKPLPPLPKAVLGGGHGPIPQPPSPCCPLYPAPPIPSPLSHHRPPFWLQAEPGNPSLVPWGQRSLPGAGTPGGQRSALHPPAHRPPSPLAEHQLCTRT